MTTTERFNHIASLLRHAALCDLLPDYRRRAFSASYWLHLNRPPQESLTEGSGSPVEGPTAVEGRTAGETPTGAL